MRSETQVAERDGREVGSRHAERTEQTAALVRALLTYELNALRAVSWWAFTHASSWEFEGRLLKKDHPMFSNY